jgi:hypothetical protein
MGHGAPKKIDAIPTSAIVNIYAAEGLLYQAMRDLTEALKRCLDGSTDPNDWKDLDTHRKQVVFYNMQYTRAIQSLQFNQGKA